MRALMILALVTLSVTAAVADGDDTACPVGGYTAITCPITSDAITRGAIVTRLAGSVSSASNPVWVDVTDGRVTVWGQVDNPGKIDLALMLISTVRGVECIDNRLCLTAASQRDLEILAAVRNRLSKSTFPTMQMGVQVSEGVVQLTGVAPTDYVREQAAMVAASAPGVTTVYNNLVISSQGGMF